MELDKFDELADTFFFYIIKYMTEETELNLKDRIKTYITRENRAIELKLATDGDMYAGVIIRSLKKLDYFETSPNGEMYRLTENGKAHFRRMQEIQNR